MWKGNTPPCTPVQRASAVCLSVKNTNPWHRSQGERVKCSDVRVSDTLFAAKLWLLRSFSESLILKLPDFYWDISWLWDADFKACSELFKSWRRKKNEIQHCEISYSKNNQDIKFTFVHRKSWLFQGNIYLVYTVWFLQADFMHLNFVLFCFVLRPWRVPSGIKTVQNGQLRSFFGILGI